MMTAMTSRLGLAFVLGVSVVGGAQTMPRDQPGPGDAVVKHADAPIVIVRPVVDKGAGQVRLPGAFWNQHMTSWVEVAMCGRPSDFLHETIVCVTTTKAILMEALRAAGCHDADEWVTGVEDFPKIRGDQVMIELRVTRAGKVETYSLDELLEYEGWGVAQGPYGWMYKGEPGEENSKLKTQNSKPLEDGGEESDRTKIVRDDPQIALVLKGIQHFSQSFAEHPLAYDDWIYPMMRYGRNTKLLPMAVYDSNGDVPVEVVIRKVTEEELLTESARVWHDRAFAAYMLQQMATAKAVDVEKAELWGLLPEVKKLSEVPAEKRDALREGKVFGRAGVLAAKIEAGYAELDAAWGVWACEHPQFESSDAKELEELRLETGQWKTHLTLRRERADQLAVAVDAAFDAKQLAYQPENTLKLQHLRGVEIAARSAALLAENQQPREFWKAEDARLDRKTDPRADWIRQIDTQVALNDARSAAGASGVAYGKALRDADAEGTPALTALQNQYAGDMQKMTLADLRLRLANVDFEISKREGFTDDPDLPKLQVEKKAIEQSLKDAGEKAGAAK
jgi:hypothetical protein